MICATLRPKIAISKRGDLRHVFSCIPVEFQRLPYFPVVGLHGKPTTFPWITGNVFFLTYPAPAGEDYREAMLVITYG